MILGESLVPFLRAINEPMKHAAVLALVEVARRGEEVPAAVRNAYPDEKFEFGRHYIIPKPFDPRVLQFVAPAVAKAAMDTGVARTKIDLVEYAARLEQRIGDLART